MVPIMTNFLEIDRDYYLISEIVSVQIDETGIIIIARNTECWTYDYDTVEQAENVYLKVKQQLEAWHLNQNKIHSSIRYRAF